MRALLPTLAIPYVLTLLACAPQTGAPVAPPTHDEIVAAREAWDDVYAVLTHPRCMNCHPAGDAPLQNDESTPHTWGVNRAAVADGLECAGCHRDTNTPGGPPGAPGWHFPPGDTPMVFEGRDPTTLCAQLHDEAATGDLDLDGLLAHVGNEPLVLWAWVPGEDRSPPPLAHADFLDAFAIWVQGGGACPEGDIDPQ